MKRVAILGAGLSGLSAAWFLKKRGLTPFLFEASSHPGGVVRTGQEEAFLFEHGPNSLLLNGGDLDDLISGLELEGEIVEANKQARKRFIVRRGKAVEAPLSVFQFITSPLLGLPAKFRLLAEPFQGKCQQPDESLASFARRRLGPEVLDYLLNPFVSGVYAGTPEKLSAKYSFPLLWEMEQNHGSLLVGFLKRRRKKAGHRSRLVSFRNGIQTLTDSLAAAAGESLRLRTPVEKIVHDGETWLINGEPFDAVISTLPLHQLSSLPLALSDPRPDIPYAPVTVWHLGFEHSRITHPLDGFGMLVPEVEKRNILGCLFPSTLFPGRAPSGKVLLTVFCGGSRQPELTQLDDEASLKLVLDDLGLLLGLKGSPCWKKRITWEKAIPQYELGHEKFLQSLADYERKQPGLFLSGNYRDGISVANCISGARHVSQRVAGYLAP